MTQKTELQYAKEWLNSNFFDDVSATEIFHKHYPNERVLFDQEHLLNIYRKEVIESWKRSLPDSSFIYAKYDLGQKNVWWDAYRREVLEKEAAPTISEGHKLSSESNNLNSGKLNEVSVASEKQPEGKKLMSVIEIAKAVDAIGIPDPDPIQFAAANAFKNVDEYVNQSDFEYGFREGALWRSQEAPQSSVTEEGKLLREGLNEAVEMLKILVHKEDEGDVTFKNPQLKELLCESYIALSKVLSNTNTQSK